MQSVLRGGPAVHCPLWPPTALLLGGHEYHSLMVLPTGPLHVHLSHQVWPQRNERCGRGTPANVACAECTQMCIVWERIRGLKGLLIKLEFRDEMGLRLGNGISPCFSLIERWSMAGHSFLLSKKIIYFFEHMECVTCICMWTVHVQLAHVQTSTFCLLPQKFNGAALQLHLTTVAKTAAPVSLQTNGVKRATMSYYVALCMI